MVQHFLFFLVLLQQPCLLCVRTKQQDKLEIERINCIYLIGIALWVRGYAVSLPLGRRASVAQTGK